VWLPEDGCGFQLKHVTATKVIVQLNGESLVHVRQLHGKRTTPNFFRVFLPQ